MGAVFKTVPPRWWRFNDRIGRGHTSLGPIRGVTTQACARAAAQSPLGSPLAQHTPAGRMGDHGKQVSWLAAWSPFITFPDYANPVVFDVRRTAYSCGGSPGLFTRVPLNPHTEELVVCAYVAAKHTKRQLSVYVVLPLLVDRKRPSNPSGAYHAHARTPLVTLLDC